MKDQSLPGMVKVWDRLVRCIHWSVAFLVLGNFVNESGSTWHRYAGYACVTLVLLRLIWGVVGSGYAHFSQWMPTVRGVWDYFRSLLNGTPRRYLGLNPAGASMALLFWSLIFALGITGKMMGLDQFWGEEWLENLHATLAYILLGGISIHVFSAVAMSIKHRENLIKAMVTGKKRASPTSHPREER